jgi:hypothetical protein
LPVREVASQQEPRADAAVGVAGDEDFAVARLKGYGVGRLVAREIRDAHALVPEGLVERPVLVVSRHHEVVVGSRVGGPHDHDLAIRLHGNSVDQVCVRPPAEIRY